MAFDKYKDGAWTEPEESVKRYSNGAWVDCDTAKRYIDGAWTEVWANVKIMTELSNDITKGILDVTEEGLKITFFKYMDYFTNWYGTIEGGGTITFYLDGNWTNPTFSFDWEGGFTYKTGKDATTWNRVSAGSISLYSRTTSGNVSTTKVVDPVGSTVAASNSVDTETGHYEGSLTGTFNRLGISFYISSFSGSFYSSALFLILNNLRIDGRKIGFPESSEFDNQEAPY